MRSPLEMGLADQDEVVEGLACLPDKTLGISIAVGRLWRGFDDFDTLGLEDLVESLE